MTPLLRLLGATDLFLLLALLLLLPVVWRYLDRDARVRNMTGIAMVLEIIDKAIFGFFWLRGVQEDATVILIAGILVSLRFVLIVLLLLLVADLRNKEADNNDS